MKETKKQLHMLSQELKIPVSKEKFSIKEHNA